MLFVVHELDVQLGFDAYWQQRHHVDVPTPFDVEQPTQLQIGVGQGTSALQNCVSTVKSHGAPLPLLCWMMERVRVCVPASSMQRADCVHVDHCVHVAYTQSTAGDGVGAGVGGGVGDGVGAGVGASVTGTGSLTLESACVSTKITESNTDESESDEKSA